MSASGPSGPLVPNTHQLNLYWGTDSDFSISMAGLTSDEGARDQR